METTNQSKHATLLEANTENIQATFEKIKKYADERGYRIDGELKLPTNLIGITKSMSFDSWSQEKVLRNYINRLSKHVTMGNANRFLHFLFKKVYKIDTSDAPSMEYSEQEIKIRQARKAWIKTRTEAEALRVAYRKEKGDFYKKK